MEFAQRIRHLIDHGPHLIGRRGQHRAIVVLRPYVNADRVIAILVYRQFDTIKVRGGPQQKGQEFPRRL